MEQTTAEDQKVPLNLRIDPGVYEAFRRKAERAGQDVETFLANTLTIVLGCRAFDTRYEACSVTEADRNRQCIPDHL